MVDMLSTLWAELRDAGVMTGEEYAATTFARRERTVGDMDSPVCRSARGRSDRRD